MMPRNRSRETQSSLSPDTLIPTVKDDALAQAKLSVQKKKKSKKQAIVARPVQAQAKIKEMGEGSTTMKAKEANQEEKKAEKK